MQLQNPGPWRQFTKGHSHAAGSGVGSGDGAGSGAKRGGWYGFGQNYCVLSGFCWWRALVWTYVHGILACSRGTSPYNWFRDH